MLVGATAALSGVFASFVSIKGLSETATLTHDVAGGRYLLPVLLAWFATMLTLFFRDQPSPAPDVPADEAESPTPHRN